MLSWEARLKQRFVSCFSSVSLALSFHILFIIAMCLEKKWYILLFHLDWKSLILYLHFFLQKGISIIFLFAKKILALVIHTFPIHIKQYKQTYNRNLTGKRNMMNTNCIPVLFLKCYSQRSQKLDNIFYAFYLLLPPLVPNVGYLFFSISVHLARLWFWGQELCLVHLCKQHRAWPNRFSVNECGIDVTFCVYINKHKHFGYLYAILWTSSLNIANYQ